MSATVTDAQRALAISFNAWVQWPGKTDRCIEADQAMSNLTTFYENCGLARDGEPTAKGRDLLDRARKAGVL